MKKNIYQFRGWKGIDASNEISLFEYGFLYNPKAKVTECNIVYGVKFECAEYTKFAYSSINWEELISESWIDFNILCKNCETKREDYNTFSTSALYDILMVYGFEEVFGTNYSEGFEINHKG
jgi:hypothetical protein